MFVDRRGNCKNVTLGMDCEVGLRRRTYNVLAGSVLSVWARVENVLAAKTGHNSKMQVVRLRTGEGVKIVGKYSNVQLKVPSTSNYPLIHSQPVFSCSINLAILQCVPFPCSVFSEARACFRYRHIDPQELCGGPERCAVSRCRKNR